MKVVLLAAATLALLVLAVWVGLRVPARPFGPFDGAGEPLATRPLPEGLPAPVERFYRSTYGAAVPEIPSAVIGGRGRLRIAGVTFPARFRFAYDPGRGYRHVIHATLYGFPILRVNETYLDGAARLELPFGVTENEPKVDAAANLGLWAEGMWFPATYLTDERVRWEPIDDVTAVLAVPFGEATQRFVARFDPETGLIRLLESMRYKAAEDDAPTLWLNDARTWSRVDGHPVPSSVALVWLDDGTPWAEFEVEEVVYGAGVDAFLRAGAP